MNSSYDDQRGWLTPVNFNLSELQIQLPDGSRLLNSAALSGIRNAWHYGTIIDNAGHIWVRGDKLHTILRTTQQQARAFVGDVEKQYKHTFTIKEGDEQIQRQCILGAEIARALDEIIQSPGSARQRKYGQYSWELYTIIRDAPEVSEIVHLHLEHVNSQLSTLKQRRITLFNLNQDELTGYTLYAEPRRSHFSHIRAKRMYPHLALEVWNGLIVNDDTHKTITEAEVFDEEGLLEVCRERSWSTSWYHTYLQQVS
jgi:hypothetical protein